MWCEPCLIPLLMEARLSRCEGGGDGHPDWRGGGSDLALSCGAWRDDIAPAPARDDSFGTPRAHGGRLARPRRQTLLCAGAWGLAILPAPIRRVTMIERRTQSSRRRETTTTLRSIGDMKTRARSRRAECSLNAMVGLWPSLMA